MTLETGAFESIETGFAVTLTTDFMAQDEHALYIRPAYDSDLVALRKLD